MRIKNAIKLLRDGLPQDTRFSLDRVKRFNEDGEFLILFVIYIHKPGDSTIAKYEYDDLDTLVHSVISDVDSELIEVGRQMLLEALS